jgi:2-polyprenyl-3-methyl-5-hydroxy-6-metoxy-1,4-benzoquinol methylase
VAAEKHHEFFGSDELAASAPGEDLNASMVRAVAYMAGKLTSDPQQIKYSIEKNVTLHRSRKFASRAFDYLASQGIDIRQGRLMDLGAGLGTVSEEAAVRGANPVAIEPGSGFREIVSRRIERTGRGMVVAASAESLPFPDNSFDIVISMEVLEHVESPTAMLREICRIIRPGGWLYLTCPNYLSFREVHYDMAWLPFLPKTLGRLYLRLRRKPTEFFERSITYTTLPWVRRRLRALGLRSVRELEMAAMCRSPASINTRWKRAVVTLVRTVVPIDLMIKAIACFDRTIYFCRHLCTPGIAELVQKQDSTPFEGRCRLSILLRRSDVGELRSATRRNGSSVDRLGSASRHRSSLRCPCY